MITNDSGDVKVVTENGTTKWLPKHLVENKFLLKSQKLTVVEAPLSFPPVEDSMDEFQEEAETNTEIIKEKVADLAPAKSSKKTKK